MAAVALAVNRWLEVWVSPDVAADHLLVLRSVDSGGCELVDPQNDWNEVQYFDSYEAAYYWLSQETYQLVDGRCAMR
jgi:uncharacterized protein YciU (UPF0263 family)